MFELTSDEDIILPERYRRDRKGALRSTNLILEFNCPKDIDHENNVEVAPFFCMKRYDYTWNGHTYLSIPRIYQTFNDPTEYEFAMTTFGSWTPWKRLHKSPKMRLYLQEMRDEMEIRIRSQSLANVAELCSERSSVGLSAAKYILEKKWETVISPHRIKTTREKKKIEALDNKVSDDIKRLGLVLDTKDYKVLSGDNT